MRSTPNNALLCFILACFLIGCEQERYTIDRYDRYIITDVLRYKSAYEIYVLQENDQIVPMKFRTYVNPNVRRVGKHLTFPEKYAAEFKSHDLFGVRLYKDVDPDQDQYALLLSHDIYDHVKGGVRYKPKYKAFTLEIHLHRKGNIQGGSEKVPKGKYSETRKIHSIE